MVSPGWEFRDWLQQFEQDDDALANYIAERPLAAINEAKDTIVIIRGYAEGLNAPPDTNSPTPSYGMAYFTTGMSTYVRLPASLHYESISISGSARTLNDRIEIQSSDGTTVTHFAELFRVLDPFATLDESERLARFRRLKHDRLVPKPRVPLEVDHLMSEVIGRMDQHDEFEDWWIAKEVAIPFFDGQKIDVIARDIHPGEQPGFMAKADEALRQFFLHTRTARLAASAAVNQDCREFLDAVGAEDHNWADSMLAIENPAEIWNFVHPQSIGLGFGYPSTQTVFVSIECECEWEQEHGLQLVFAGGRRLTRIGPLDGSFE